MPQVAAWIATAIIGATGATGAAAAAITIGVSVAVTAGTTAAITALATPQTRAAEGRATEWIGDPDAPYPFVSGRRGTAGMIRARDTSGPNNRYQHIVTVYSAGGPISAFGDFLLDSSVKTFTGDLMDGAPVNRLWRQTKLGAQPDTVLTTPSVSPSPTWTGWTSAHKLSGKACSMITLRQDGDLKYWPSGEPKTLQVINGMLAWDPRLDGTWPGGSGSCRLATPSTWVYSTNPIIHALKWALGIKHNGVMVGGIGASVDGIDVTSFIAAANICDTNSWTVSAVAYSDAPGGDDKMAVLETYLRAGGCIPASKQGKISLVSRAANPSSVQTITAVDIAGPFSYVPGAERNRRINTAIPRCVQEAHDWEIVDLEPVVGSTYVTEDGATRSSGVTYAYVSDADQAAQLAAYDIADSREWEPFTIPLKPYMRNLEPGNAFVIDDAANLGITSQKFLVLSRSYDPATDRVDVRVTTETAAKHAFALGETGTAPASPTLAGTDPLAVPTPSGSDWTLAAGAGTVPSFTITGAVPPSVTVGKIVVEHKSNAGSDWKPIGEFSPDTTKIEEFGITADTSWIARMKYRSALGVLGDTWFTFASPITSGAATISGQGDLAVLDQVDTPEIINNAATLFEDQYSPSGYGGLGTRDVAYSTSTGSATTLLDEFTVTTSGVGTVTVVWFGVLQWTRNVGVHVDVWLYSDTTDKAKQTHNGNANNMTSTIVLSTSIDVLSAGSHTFYVYGRCDASATPVPYIDVGASFIKLEGKK